MSIIPHTMFTESCESDILVAEISSLKGYHVGRNFIVKFEDDDRFYQFGFLFLLSGETVGWWYEEVDGAGSVLIIND